MIPLRYNNEQRIYMLHIRVYIGNTFSDDLSNNCYCLFQMGFQFISTCLTLLPVVDCSDQIPNHPELTEDEKELCYATSQFNDFVLQLLDR